MGKGQPERLEVIEVEVRVIGESRCQMLRGVEDDRAVVDRLRFGWARSPRRLTPFGC